MSRRITLKQLNVFVETAMNKYITIAAEKCYITQPSASKAILQLEEALQKVLFERGAGKEISLTYEGELLFVEAKSILDRVSELIKDKENITGKIVIGASVTICDYVLPKILPQFQKLFPKINIRIERVLSDRIRYYVENAVCDIGLVEGRVIFRELEQTLWKEDRIEIICAKNHELAKKDKVSLEEVLVGQNWVLWHHDMGTRDIYIQTKGREKLTQSFGFGAEDLGNGLLKFSEVAWDNQENITRASTNYISSSIVFDSAEAIKNYVANSNFLASLSKTMLDNTICNDIKILNVEGGYQTRDFYILKHKQRFFSQASDVFLDWISNYNL
ncbi:LysR family transcriptional regulator [Francisella tularensis subsp. holarctica FSC022]|uniref:LysR family transcriptional regulator n=1 Tax=Francisella tularensis TaxID=263 RepID=UPI00015D7A3D|nr:LysR family transcriptional regulator [Francisella tularensis]EDO66865.1 transcriptional regulator [Francisella tularensis subsp. holarctica FSC022]KIP31811.1 bacterial regulatory helix-turn-helix, lysR family protein [Francisella tularensis subsp. holarctica]MCC9172293.1 LysR family transcriptional regulator [Francisella tularensis]OCQ63188.1 LysR family transcriptional regulator [Francisella tularensis]OPH22911.1 LysR family transcriptional regulator [Francisella tularensis subsp. holarct